ncbi:MAG: hypothetical protein A2528_03775 [Candidatus Staskawiczbacteria bacterium RIFOXYD2_FULL_37_9]|uniref:Uncharacterized protein n=1 Tax=Candidatus Staskawiczbacteria bacterium RIFOXYB1_FULL_37_44 TaxID=1802223 RepID=A0A1G2IX39_9BACT|nr:MAG: hypothetical protein A2358_00320 [Candidatus Staskawiczbacteria bacterium RIFOXYB1_FULL_37_44]OGZ83678.1 MAG: hypothetical protein A2416_03690 [Candidatus Staskawiczbacteria bacterium RIFOXYC1_FULL_37_52]OGZ88490.1 MAG: hypothetical protein A2444_02665 [Candidatus Staskawiczbacteria bacterium RIFOXYC2_FULL_37_19]OGZ90202.1 MAG: hypothetical protein A2581_02220 [Candidatus Staskawiczbacteria bacterium RIFOXYD1_FULL_37_110]OGZ94853.1 MAG: hypothetical protein A2528_03775 [Candidatus Stask
MGQIFITLIISIIILALAVIGVLALYFFFWRPLLELTKTARLARTTKNWKMPNFSRFIFLGPLASEIYKMALGLKSARQSAREEARLKLEKSDTPWTEERLKEFMKSYLKDRNIYMVSSTEPYVHEKKGNKISYRVPASGMVTAVESLMRAAGGVWLAHGRGNADKFTADSNGRIQVPPDDPKYTLRRVWLTEKNEKGFYIGFSNEALWPLFHMVHVRPIFRKEDWQEYRTVNSKFLQILLDEIKNVKNPLIFIQDFHFTVLPKMIKKMRPDAQIAVFWHIPWPSAETFSICPWRKEILEGLLGADLLGFHTQLYANNFIHTVSKEVESLIDTEQDSITKNNHTTYVKAFPISVPFSGEEEKSLDENQARKFLDSLNIKTKYFGIGVERMDYIKGIMERFRGIEFFFESYPNFLNQFTFLQIAPPSREAAQRYRQIAEDVTNEAERINQKFRNAGWQPIVLLKEHHSHEEIYPLYRLADICMVTSLHDGMNLVSKEFVAARNDEAGVLILSQFAGASRELKDAIIINPYNAEETARAMHIALTMPKPEQRMRMKKLRDAVKNYNVYKWSADLIKSIISID